MSLKQMKACLDYHFYLLSMRDPYAKMKHVWTSPTICLLQWTQVNILVFSAKPEAYASDQ